MLLYLCGVDTDSVYAVSHICKVLDAVEENLTLVWKNDEKRLDTVSSNSCDESVQGGE